MTYCPGWAVAPTKRAALQSVRRVHARACQAQAQASAVRLLLDTHVFLWFLGGDSRLSRSARRRIEDAHNDKFLSIASVWEMAVKVGLGKLDLDDPLAELVDRGAGDNSIALLGIAKEHAIAVSALPHHHADPFDRLLVAQAMREGMAIVTCNPAFGAYAVKRVW